MTTGETIGSLKALKRAVLEDGRVDWDETGKLLETIRPLAAKRGILFQDYERLLEKCRADGRITREESEKLADQLDFLCNLFSRLRLRFWLIVMISILLTVAALAVGERVIEAAGQAKVTVVSPPEV